MRTRLFIFSLLLVLAPAQLSMSTFSWPVAQEAGPSFVDPTVVMDGGEIEIGHLVYVAPFAVLLAGEHEIKIGDGSNVQDSVTLDATKGDIILGKQVIVAHGATVKGPARIGDRGRCPGGVADCPSFVGFNAEVDGAIIEKDAMVLHLARVAPGVTIPSGRKVLWGKNLTSQAEVMQKTAGVTNDDRKFMSDVIEVNEQFAEGYHELADNNPINVRGISINPDTTFNPGGKEPTLAGVPTRDPTFRNRIIGDVMLSNNATQLTSLMGSLISLRADEGAPFWAGTIIAMDSRVTFHALEHTRVFLGNNVIYGFHSLVHGGSTSFPPDLTKPFPFNQPNTTIVEDNVRVGAYAVVFRSRIGDNARVGFKSLVENTNVAAFVVVRDCRVVIDGVDMGAVEWCY
jgi:carbonic anhydrase/acetyltransferase-like protein (isoleucine patch superfamily)